MYYRWKIAKIEDMVFKRFYTFPSKQRLKTYTFPWNQHLYFIPVLIYTPIKVKSKLREEKKWLRQTEHPICRSLPMIQPFFPFGCKIFVKQVDFGREKGVFPLVLIQVKNAAKRTVFGLKNKREKTFLPFKTQLFHIQIVRYAASKSIWTMPLDAQWRTMEALSIKMSRIIMQYVTYKSVHSMPCRKWINCWVPLCGRIISRVMCL